MKRFGLALGAVCLLAVGPGAAVSAGDGNDRDWVVGAIKRTYLDGTPQLHMVLNASQTNKGGVSGQLHAKYDDPFYGRTSITADVTCINAFGRNASVGVRIVKSDNPEWPVGYSRLLRVTDYGNPTVGGQQDSISPRTATPGAAVCENSFPDERTPYLSGNVDVHDGG